MAPDNALITLPSEGAPDDPPGSGILLGMDGNAFSIIGNTKRALRQAGASPEYLAAYVRLATSGDYDNVIRVSAAVLDGEDPS
jgi:hypothetical protein